MGAIISGALAGAVIVCISGYIGYRMERSGESTICAEHWQFGMIGGFVAAVVAVSVYVALS